MSNKKLHFFYISTSHSYCVLVHNPQYFAQFLTNHYQKTVMDIESNKTQNYGFGSIFLTHSEYNNYVRETLHKRELEGGIVDQLFGMKEADYKGEEPIKKVERKFTLIQGEL